MGGHGLRCAMLAFGFVTSRYTDESAEPAPWTAHEFLEWQFQHQVQRGQDCWPRDWTFETLRATTVR